MRSKPPTLEQRRKSERAAAKRKALRALRKARLAAENAGVELSSWEGEFLGDVEARVVEHGRAFADPDKGAPGQALSARQSRKLKEIAAKANGGSAQEPASSRRTFQRSSTRRAKSELPDG